MTALGAVLFTGCDTSKAASTSPVTQMPVRHVRPYAIQHRYKLIAPVDPMGNASIGMQRQKEMTMRSHKFKIGQTVVFTPNMSHVSTARGSYEIVRLLPSETADCQYRVKNSRDGHERVVRESDLS